MKHDAQARSNGGQDRGQASLTEAAADSENVVGAGGNDNEQDGGQIGSKGFEREHCGGVGTELIPEACAVIARAFAALEGMRSMSPANPRQVERRARRAAGAAFERGERSRHCPQYQTL
jgi:hypothetical protein